MAVVEWERDSQVSVLNSRAPDKGREGAGLGEVMNSNWGLLNLRSSGLSQKRVGYVCHFKNCKMLLKRM